jgi:membrane fusion protein, heavy metal efflux system
LRAYLANVTQPATLGALALGVVLGAAFVALTRKRRAAALALLFLLAFFPAPGAAHEGHDHGDQKTSSLSTGGELAQRLSDGTIFVPKPVQRIFSIRTALTESGSFNRSIELPGRVIPDPNASGFVQASVGGRLSAPPGGFPRLGTQVKEGDVLAYVTPPLQAIDVSDMRQRQGELEQQISIVARRLARYEQLAPSGAVARSQLEDTRLELEGLKERRASLDKVRREAESLVAPVAGVIADGTPVAGQITQPNAVVFHIVDPWKLWVEALSFAAITTSSASATTASGKNLKLAFRGSGFADRNQTIPVHFAVEGDAGGLRAGQFVTVLVTTDEKKQGIAVPRTALVRNANGQDFVFEHVAAERFAARAVRTEPLDGERILILAGVERGKRIVVQGAELLDHVR